MAKYTNIDPYNCTIEELKAEIERIKNIENFYNTQQLGVKIWINSCYGALANRFCEVYNVNLAEAITLQGQHIIHFSSKIFDNYFNNVFPKDTQLHQKLNIDHELASQPIDIDTYQIYGDSVTGDSIVNVFDGKKYFDCRIDELFNNSNPCTQTIIHDRYYRFNDDIKIKTFDKKSNKILYLPIKYIFKHKPDNKFLYVIEDQHNNSITCTEDHSIMVLRNNELIKIQPEFINVKTDQLIISNNYEYSYSYIKELKKIYLCNEYVYDIEVNDNNHWFFANNILVHNTDSVQYDSKIKTDNGEFTIEELFDKNKNNNLKELHNGKLIVESNDKILNFKNDSVEYVNIKHIIKHKTSKKKYKLRTKSGKEIICTEDHSLIVFRDGKKIKVKPNEILNTDKVLVIDN